MGKAEAAKPMGPDLASLAPPTCNMRLDLSTSLQLPFIIL